MAEFKTPVKKPNPLNGDKITIPPSPFLNRLGYGTGKSMTYIYLYYLAIVSLTYNSVRCFSDAAGPFPPGGADPLAVGIEDDKQAGETLQGLLRASAS